MNKSEYQNTKSKIVSNFMLQISNFQFQAGQSLVEIILAIGLSAILLPALLTGLVSSRQGKVQQNQRTQAVYLLNETVDSVRSVREKGWVPFAVNGIFHPVISDSNWTLVNGPITNNGFTQTVVIGDVNRNTSGEIVTSGGSLDPSSKKVDITISWQEPYSSSINATLYFTRYLDNNSFTQTTVLDFDTGTKSGTTVTNTDGGEIILGAGGQGNWCSPNLSITALDLPKNGTANAISAYEGRAIAGTGENSSGVSLADITISDQNPPTASVVGTFDGYKTNDVFIDGNYAYLATDSNSKEVVIVNLTTDTEVGHFNAPGSLDATSVYVLEDKGYVTSGFNLYVFDLSNKNGGRPQLGSGFVFLGTANNVVVNGNYAYVALNLSEAEMQIIDISNPQALQNVGWANVNGNNGKRVFVNQSATRAYLVVDTDSSLNEFFIIDISQKTGSRLTVGSYNTNGMDPKSLSVVTGNKAIIVGTGAEEYQVIDISNELSPVRCGGLNIDSGVKGISSVLEIDGDAYSYIVTADANSELKIIEGGPGGQYANSGTFISSTFDSGFQTAFNRFDVSLNRPSSTDLQFQIAVSPSIDGGCSEANFSFVGPDATSSTFFTTNQTSGVENFSYPISPSINPGQCFKYEAYFTSTDFGSTPVFNDIKVNYSP